MDTQHMSEKEYQQEMTALDARLKQNMNPFAFITALLTIALDALGLDQEQITGNFTLELDGGWLAHITFTHGYAVLIDYDRVGDWQVGAHAYIPGDGFFLHTLYCNSTFEAMKPYQLYKPHFGSNL